jgi:hypothetical protein
MEGPRLDLSNNIYQDLRSIVLVFSRLPELVQASASNDQRRVNLQTVRTKCRVLKVFLKPFQISVATHVGKIRHHVADNLQQ